MSESLTRDESDADDLVQETYLKAYRAWDSYTPGTECRGWLFTICRNTFIRARQRADRQVACDDPELEALAASASKNGVRGRRTVSRSSRQGASCRSEFQKADTAATAAAASSRAASSVRRLTRSHHSMLLSLATASNRP